MAGVPRASAFFIGIPSIIASPLLLICPPIQVFTASCCAKWAAALRASKLGRGRASAAGPTTKKPSNYSLLCSRKGCNVRQNSRLVKYP